MRLHKYILCAAAVTLGTVSCTTNNPWDSEMSEFAEKGQLNLNISAKTPESTKTSRAAVFTDGFHVTIKGNDEANKDFSTDYYVENDGEKKQLLLPVGNHTITATNYDRIIKQMSVPVYVGTKDITISKDVITETEVACKMANSRIHIGYSDKFLATFSTWTVTINDNSDKAITYTESNPSPKDIYWLFENNCEEISVDIKATTKDGVEVEASAKYNKKNSTEQYTDLNTNYFCGGDAIEIKFEPAEATSGNITGININTNIKFTNDDQNVVIEVADKIDDPVGPGDDPDEPGDDPQDGPIKVTYSPSQKVTINSTDTTFPNVKVDFDVENGIKSLQVFINSDNAAFQLACQDMNISGMDLTSEAAADLAAIFSLPEKNTTTYSFTMGEMIWSMLTAYGAGTHKFTLKAEDNAGNIKDGELTLIVK
ncbi:MAG: DUF4493 domain-containing protein [Bacteroidaceae bacterium]|nr:DUF4493 domain-containing protein [Bacteroidaceae bacterium]